MDDAAGSAPFDLAHGLAVLERTPAALQALLHGLDETWLRADRGKDTFSTHDVIGHLIHGERADWIERVHRILEHGETKPFEPFDRFAMKSWPDRPTAELLREFAALRAQNLATLRSLALQPADLRRLGTHPAFGPVTLGQLLHTWVAHDLDHVGQIARTLAWALRDAVGPWRAYLGILAP